MKSIFKNMKNEHSSSDDITSDERLNHLLKKDKSSHTHFYRWVYSSRKRGNQDTIPEKSFGWIGLRFVENAFDALES